MTTSPRTDDEPVLGAQTVVRALAVLGLVRRATTDVGVSEISRALALHTSTVHRILKALVSEGYLSQNPETDRYRLGRESWLLGLAVLALLVWSWGSVEMFRAASLVTDWRNMAEFGQAFLKPDFHEWRDYLADMIERVGSKRPDFRNNKSWLRDARLPSAKSDAVWRWHPLYASQYAR